MARLNFYIEIAAPADRVAAFFVPQRMPLWYGAEMETELEVQGGVADFAAGEKVRITGRLGRREVSLTAVVTQYEFGRVLEWQFHDTYGVRGMQRFEIEPMAEGETRVRLRDEYDLPGRFGKFWDWLAMRHAVEQRDRAWLAKLKGITERRSTGS